MFHNLENYDSHLTFEEIGKHDFKINLIPKIIKKYMLYHPKNQKVKGIKSGLTLVFIKSVQFLNNH